MKSDNPNPTGKHGKPFSLAPMKFDDALRKILAAPPEPKPERKTESKKKQKARRRST
jgi:hypothetical protein